MFIRRWKGSALYNIKLFRSVLDWTVIVYLVIPAFVIGGFSYFEAVSNLQSFSIDTNLFLLLLFIVCFVATKSSIRLYLYDADLLFYRQNERKIRLLKKSAYSYAFLTFNSMLLLIISIVSPYLLAAGFTIFELIKIAFLFNVVSLIRIIIRYKIQRSLIRIPFIFCMLTLFAWSFFIIPFWIYTLLIVISGIYLWKLIQSNRFWQMEVTIEYEEFNKWMKTVYNFSMEMKYYLPAKTKPPLFVLAKRHTFSDYRVDNLVYKTFLRKSQYIRLPLQLLAIGIGLLFILPTWAKIIVVLTVIFGLLTSLESILKEIKQAHFFRLMNVSDEEWLMTKKRLQQRLLYPLFAVIIVLFFVLL
ncbi:MAG: ABC transporter permease [Solibacillus sp.]|uniref:ABC transporter permease n=1 Tax=unclassified Solibacillus TaxID=2637870 RepID=UPI0030F9797B